MLFVRSLAGVLSLLSVGLSTSYAQPIQESKPNLLARVACLLEPKECSEGMPHDELGRLSTASSDVTRPYALQLFGARVCIGGAADATCDFQLRLPAFEAKEDKHGAS